MNSSALRICKQKNKNVFSYTRHKLKPRPLGEVAFAAEGK